MQTNEAQKQEEREREGGREGCILCMERKVLGLERVISYPLNVPRSRNASSGSEQSIPELRVRRMFARRSDLSPYIAS
jgi:hypothetical protein